MRLSKSSYHKSLSCRSWSSQGISTIQTAARRATGNPGIS